MKEDRETNMENQNVSTLPDGRGILAGVPTGDLEWKEFFGQFDTFYSCMNDTR